MSKESDSTVRKRLRQEELSPIFLSIVLDTLADHLAKKLGSELKSTEDMLANFNNLNARTAVTATPAPATGRVVRGGEREKTLFLRKSS